MDTPLPAITPDAAPAATASDQTAPRAERDDEAQSASAFSVALDREMTREMTHEMTRETNAKTPRGMSDPLPGKTDAQEHPEEPAKNTAAPAGDGTVLPLLISPFAPATPADAALPRAPAMGAVHATAPKAATGAFSPRIPAPERRVAPGLPEAGGTTSEASGPASRLPDVAHLPHTERAVAPHLPSATPDHASTDASRETVSALAADARMPGSHAAPVANNAPLIMPADLQATHPGTAPSTTVNAQPILAPPVGAVEWNDALAHKVTWMIGDQQKAAELKLNPPELGPLAIRLTMSGHDNATASAQFASPHAHVRDALEAAIPRLREILADNGITLGNATVTDGALPREGRDDTSGRFASAPVPDHPAARTAADVNSVRVAAVRSSHGLVDIFA